MLLHFQARNIALHEDSDRDVITGLQQKMNFGRPNWDQIFKGIADNHPKYVPHHPRFSVFY